MSDPNLSPQDRAAIATVETYMDANLLDDPSVELALLHTFTTATSIVRLTTPHETLWFRVVRDRPDETIEDYTPSQDERRLVVVVKARHTDHRSAPTTPAHGG
jgi:hypothetical protein